MRHYVYEIMGDKVGSTQNYPQRPIEQGAREGEYQLLWEGDSYAERLEQERYWQDEKGYKRDPFGNDVIFHQYQDSYTITLIKDESKPELLLSHKSVTIKTTPYGDIKFTGEKELRALSEILETGPYGGFYVKLKRARNLRDQLLEENVETPKIETIETPCTHDNTIQEFQQIRDWATDKGIFTSGDPKTQYIKLQEEAGEVAKAILNNDEPEIIDGLGDVLVVLINLSHLCGYKLESCLATAYDVIKKRKGKMVCGTFVKDN